MAQYDRTRLIAELDRLGAEGDDEALAAARGVAATMREWGLGWDALLRSVPDGQDEPLPADEPEIPLAAGDIAADSAVVDQLLARELSEETRLELTDIKANIAAGTFDAMDSRYIRALARKLGA
jgi:hypothetical protein